jgi:thymidylate synthase
VIEHSMVHVFSGTTADQVWLAAARAIGTWGAPEQASRGGPTREILHAVLEISEPQQRWTPSRRPAVNPAFAIVEALWILFGRDDEALPTFFNPRFPDFNGPGPAYEGAYGYRLRRAFGLDQLARAADALASKPDSRQVVLQIWDSSRDMPGAEGTPRRADIPCNVASLLKVRDGRLQWTQVLRSNDLVLGVPHNIVQFTMLQEVLAGWLGLEIGPYVQLSDSLHVYVHDLENVTNASPAPAVRSGDSLALSMSESRVLLEDLEQRLNGMIRADTDRPTFQRLASPERLPPAYRNHLAIVSADAARRRKWNDLMEQSAADCSNPALVQMWERWLARVVERQAQQRGSPTRL